MPQPAPRPKNRRKGHGLAAAANTHSDPHRAGGGSADTARNRDPCHVPEAVSESHMHREFIAGLCSTVLLTAGCTAAHAAQTEREPAATVDLTTDAGARL